MLLVLDLAGGQNRAGKGYLPASLAIAASHHQPQLPLIAKGQFLSRLAIANTNLHQDRHRSYLDG